MIGTSEVINVIGCPKVFFAISDFSGRSCTDNKSCISRNITFMIMSKWNHTILKYSVLPFI